MKIERFRELGPEPSPGPAAGRLGRAAVAAVGNFDGVHLGHRRTLRLARREAEARAAELVAVTFDPHPARLLRPERAPKGISSTSLKAEQLAALGVERLVVLEFGRELANATPAAFVERLFVGRLGAVAVVQGGNFRFGRGRRGDLGVLRELGARHGFEVIEAPAVERRGEVVSSTRIRHALAAADLDLAAALLGRPYEVAGAVVPGRGRGRELGFPTANLEPEGDVLVPPGVYAAEAVAGPSAGFRPLRAVVHHGPRPTFRDSPSLEAHLIGFSGEIASLRLRFRAFLREIEAFDGPESLRLQLERDVARALDPAPADGGSVAAPVEAAWSLDRAARREGRAAAS